MAALLRDPEARELIGSFPLSRLAAWAGSPIDADTVTALMAAVGTEPEEAARA